MAKITIMGTGGFGVALAVMCHRFGHDVTLWGKFPEEIQQIRSWGEHKKLLPGVAVHSGIHLTSDLEEGRCRPLPFERRLGLPMGFWARKPW